MGRLRPGCASKPAESVVSADFRGLVRWDSRTRRIEAWGALGDGTRASIASRAMKRVLAGFVLGALSLDGAAAADIPLKAPRVQQIVDWTGLYFGAHAGFGRGHSNAVLSDPSIATTSNSFGGPIGGLQAGYNVQLPSRIVLGFEADVSFPNYIDGNSVISTLATAKSYVVEQMDFTGSARGRLGYAAGPFLFYATGGLAFTGERLLNTPAAGNDEKK